MVWWTGDWEHENRSPFNSQGARRPVCFGLAEGGPPSGKSYRKKRTFMDF